VSRLYMETTKIPAAKTAQEITTLLARTGARQVVIEYDESRELAGVRWTIERRGITIPFGMPARIEPVFRILMRKSSPRTRARREPQIREQAKRVAWRQLLRWLEAQLALIETGMVAAEEVFMPYIEVSQGKSMFEALCEQEFRALPAPAERSERNC